MWEGGGSCADSRTGRTFDLETERAATPVCEHLNHLNNAGASPSTRAVLAVIGDHLVREARLGPMETAQAAAGELSNVYASAAGLLGCGEDEVALVGGQSHGFQLTVGGIPFSPGDRILTTPAEWGGNFMNLQRLAAANGASLEVIPTGPDGVADVSALEAMLDERVRLVSLTWCPANGGVVHPAAEVGLRLKGRDLIYMVDAAQMVGQRPVDVEAISCDVLTTSGRKWLRGPRGVGLLYIRKTRLADLQTPLLDVFSATWRAPQSYRPREDVRRYETSEKSIALQLGLGAAIDHALHLGLGVIQARVEGLAQRLRTQLSTLPDVQMLDLGSVDRCGLVSFAVTGMDAQDVKHALAAQGVNAGANGGAYTPLDMADRGLGGVVRLSPHYFNSEAEIDHATAAVESLARVAHP